MNSSNNINPIWNAATSYSVQIAAALFAGFEPTDFYYSDNSSLTNCNTVYKKIGDDYVEDNKEAKLVQAAYSILINSIKDNSLSVKLHYLTYPLYVIRFNIDKNNTDKMTPDELLANPIIDWRETRIEKEDFKQWLLSRNSKPEFFFGEKTSNEPDYMNPQHPRYSAKLAATVMAWQAMDNENFLLRKSAKDAMIDWLTIKYEELGLTYENKISIKAIKECATVANWSRGGAPTTPEKTNLPTP